MAVTGDVATSPLAESYARRCFLSSPSDLGIFRARISRWNTRRLVYLWE